MAPSRTFLPESRLRPPPDQSSHSRAFDLSSPPLRDPPVTLCGPASSPICCRNHFSDITVPLEWRSLWYGPKGPGIVITSPRCEFCIGHFLAGWQWPIHQPPRFTIFTCGFGPSRKFGIKIKWDGMGEKNAKRYVSIRYILTIYLIMNLQIWVVLLNVCPKVVVSLSLTHTQMETIVFVLDSGKLVGIWEENEGTHSSLMEWRETGLRGLKAHNVFGKPQIIWLARAQGLLKGGAADHIAEVQYWARSQGLAKELAE